MPAIATSRMPQIFYWIMQNTGSCNMAWKPWTEMPSLQKEKVSLEEKMNTGNLSYDELQKAAERINEIIKLLDEKEMRWLELSERM